MIPDNCICYHEDTYIYVFHPECPAAKQHLGFPYDANQQSFHLGVDHFLLDRASS